MYEEPRVFLELWIPWVLPEGIVSLSDLYSGHSGQGLNEEKPRLI